MKLTSTTLIAWALLTSFQANANTEASRPLVPEIKKAISLVLGAAPSNSPFSKYLDLGLDESNKACNVTFERNDAAGSNNQGPSLRIFEGPAPMMNVVLSSTSQNVVVEQSRNSVQLNVDVSIGTGYSQSDLVNVEFNSAGKPIAITDLQSYRSAADGSLQSTTYNCHSLSTVIVLTEGVQKRLADLAKTAYQAQANHESITYVSDSTSDCEILSANEVRCWTSVAKDPNDEGEASVLEAKYAVRNGAVTGLNSVFFSYDHE